MTERLMVTPEETTVPTETTTHSLLPPSRFPVRRKAAMFCYEIHFKLSEELLKRDGWLFDQVKWFFHVHPLFIFLNELLDEGLWRI